MTREIKFREWHNNHMRTWEEINSLHMRVLNDERGVFEQYTGFEDFYGKEIYEGDIICDTDDNTIIGAVKFYDGSWQVGDDLLLDMMYYSVVGNIHENPELLEDK